MSNLMPPIPGDADVLTASERIEVYRCANKGGNRFAPITAPLGFGIMDGPRFIASLYKQAGRWYLARPKHQNKRGHFQAAGSVPVAGPDEALSILVG